MQEMMTLSPTAQRGDRAADLGDHADALDDEEDEQRRHGDVDAGRGGRAGGPDGNDRAPRAAALDAALGEMRSVALPTGGRGATGEGPVSTSPATTRAVDLPRVGRALARLAAHLQRHPEIRDRTARWLAGVGRGTLWRSGNLCKGHNRGKP